MGIFSLFGKKDSQQVASPAIKDAARKKRRDKGASRSTPDNGTERSQKIQRTAAHATAMKIDAIESEMSSEFVRSPPSTTNTLAGPPGRFAMSVAAPAKPQATESAQPLEMPSLLPLMGPTTEFLLHGETVTGAVRVYAASEDAPVIEEAAILFANGQVEMVEQLLRDAIRQDSVGNAAHTVWAMLFDLYQVSGQRQPFDSLSIEYANKFEMSPPAWVDTIGTEAQTAPTGAAPVVSFSGKIDNTIVKQLERAQDLAQNNVALRLEFARVTDVDPIGCGLLLRVLKKLQKSGNDLVLVGAQELVDKIRSILAVGRRDETEAPWLLLLEILQLLNREKDFEEASIDYCVTFEVSPPAFVAPGNKVTSAAHEYPLPHGDSATAVDCFMMPEVIEGSTNHLVLAIAAYAALHNPARIDCSRLRRVTFSAAGQLLSGLASFRGNGTVLELHNVNHLVAALFTMMGIRDIVRILPSKN